MSAAILFLAAFLSTEEAPSVDVVERQALEARGRIKSGMVHAKALGSLSAKTKTISTDAEYTIWFEGTSIRSDFTRVNGPNPDIRMSHCENCGREGWGVEYEDRTDHVTRHRPLSQFGDRSLYGAIDPRKIGYSAAPFAVLRQFRLDQVVGRTDRKDATVMPDLLNGKDCWVVRSSTKAPDFKNKSQVWISPSQGYNVVRIEISEPGSGQWIVSSDLVQWGNSKVWFPKTVKYERIVEGKQTERETLEILEAVLNEPIAKEVFTLEGINMKPGTYVQQPKDSDSGFWRDGKVDTANPPLFKDTTPPAPIEPEEKRKINYWLLAACIGLALAAIAVVVIRRRRSAAS